MSQRPLDTKSVLHPRNRHRQRYDFQALIAACPDLHPYVNANQYGHHSIDFFDPIAVKMLNRALLKRHYQIDFWDIPNGYLCPPIPGRADYIHYIADWLAQQQTQKKIPRGATTKVLDIGTGANLIYPILGQREYGWSFIGTDISTKAIQNAQSILEQNSTLQDIELRLQSHAKSIFKGMLKKDEQVTISICNPPFFESPDAARKATRRKLRNLKGNTTKEKRRNFGGTSNELWCKGGELAFIKRMIVESQLFSERIQWFSTLVSNQDHLPAIYKSLTGVNVRQMSTIEMEQGQKKSRIVVWCF